MEDVKRLTLANLDSIIAEYEAGRSQARIGDVRQIRKILFQLIKTNEDVRILLEKYIRKANGQDKVLQ